MKKKLLNTVLVMSRTLFRLIITLCIFTSISFANDTLAQQPENVKISIDAKQASLEDIFKMIEAKTFFRFTYSKNLIYTNHKITYSTKDGTVKQALDYLQKVYGLSFRQQGKNIAVNSENLRTSSNGHDRLEPFITGLIKDISTGEALPGANVLAKGTVVGTSSDSQGKFSLNLPAGAQFLVVSYIGYETQEISIGSQTYFDISLRPDPTALEAVVVIGYGTQFKSDQSGSISTVNAERIKQFPSSTLEQSLSGHVAGVQFIQSSGQPGAGTSVRIRGVTSIAGGNEPLYVIDGIPFFNSDLRGMNGLSSINQSDIESVEVLKDASATAIYGSRGGNGVILITTKSGGSNAPSIQYNSWYSLRQVRKKLDVMSGKEFLDYQNDFYTNSNLALPAEISSIQNANTDWQDEVYKSAFAQNHDVSFSGGNPSNQYYTSFGYLNEDGVVENSNFERFSIRSNMKNKLNDVFSIESSIFGSHSLQNGPTPAENSNTLSITKTGIGSTLLALPTEPVYNEGEYAMIFPYSFAAQLENPVAYAKEALDKWSNNRFLGNVLLKGKIFNGLQNNLRVGLDFQDRRRDAYYPRVFQVVLGGNGTAILQTQSRLSYLVEDYLSYSTSIKDEWIIDAVLGGSLQKETFKSQRIEGSGFISDDLTNNAIQAAQTISTPVTRNYEQTIASMFGRLNLKFKDRYLLSASIRSDGASVFSDGNKVATFPSLAAGWKLSEEKFLSSSTWISHLKLKASWGKSGNQAINPYQSKPLGVNIISSQGSGSNLSRGLAPNLPNRTLTWESTRQTNIGFESDIINARVRLTFDYYWKTTDGALSTVQLPSSAGFTSIIDNVGEVTNEGFEINLGATLVDKENFSLSVDANLSRNVNNVARTKNNQEIRETLSDSQLAGSVGGFYNVIKVGEPLGAFVGYKFNGMDESGIPTYVDFNNDGVVNASDHTVLGSPFPDFLYGFNTAVIFKKFSFSTDWQGVMGAKLLNVGQLNLTQPINYFNRASNIKEFFPIPKQGLTHRVSDRYIEDASFLRLRNVRVGYTVDLVNRTVKKMNFFVSGQNLLTSTDYSGYDPEVNSFNGNDLKQGIDLAAYPTTRSYTIGFNLIF